MSDDSQSKQKDTGMTEERESVDILTDEKPAVAEVRSTRPTPQRVARALESSLAVTTTAGHKAARTVDRALSISVGNVLLLLFRLAEFGLPGVFAIVALMPDRYLPKPLTWLGLWFVCYFVNRGAAAYKRGKRREIYESRVNSIHANVAAVVDRLSKKLASSPDRRFEVAAAEKFVISLLARIKEYAQHSLRDADAAALRVTLAVPWSDTSVGGRPCLRVWCYDHPYDSSNWTILPLPASGEEPIPGSPAAYITRSVQIIHDIKAIPSPNKFRGSFRSVLSIPVLSGGTDGECLAVVNVDSKIERYFNSDIYDRVLYPKIAPSLNLLALVLLLTVPGAQYEFN